MRRVGMELPEDAVEFRCPRCRLSEELLFSDPFLPPSAASEEPTEVVEECGIDFGDYVLLNEVARGGMGCVHRARQKSLNRIVAIKRPLPGLAADEERVRRFHTEAEAVAGLSHPNIIPVFESGEHDGEHFFSMAYVEGEPLNEVVRHRKVTPAQAAIYVRKIAEAIQHAHERGVLHRDLKPANIIVDLSDEPRIADFGIAQLLTGPSDEESQAVEGTANYMAPEQVQPGHRRLTVATDVYALGGILYHLLTGRPPFEGETRDQVYWSAYYEEPMQPTACNAAVPRDLEAICLKALEKDPAHRYASAQAMADDLLRFEQRRPVQARPVSAFGRLMMWARRSPFLALLSVLLIGAIATAIVLQWVALRSVQAARAASEGFIGFMNGDLVQDLRDAGRLDLMEKVNAKAEDYYTNYSAIGDSGYWERKALFYENTAAVEKDIGELTRAEARALQAEDTYQRQRARQPRESQWSRHLSRVRLLRFDIARIFGRQSLANQHVAAAVALATEAIQLDSKDVTNRAHLATVLLEQASFWIDEKRLDAATTNIASADAMLRELTSVAGADPDWSLGRATGAYYRGLIRQHRRDSEGALAEFTDYLALIQGLVRRFPKNTRWQFELAVAHARVGEALYKLKEYAAARSYIDVFEASARNLTHIDPRNASWLSLHGRSLAWQGSVAKALDPASTQARDYFRASLVIQSNLVIRNPDWDNWLDSMAQTTHDLASWHQTQGEGPEAIALLTQWRQQCQERALNHPDNVGHQIRWGRAIVDELQMIGRVEGKSRQIDLLTQALAQFAATPPSSPAGLAKARVLAKLAESYDTAGDPGRAATHLQQALELRLSLVERLPAATRLREMISDNFAWVVTYYLKSDNPARAVSVAEEGLHWAAKHLAPEEWRLDYAKMCWKLAEAVQKSDLPMATATRRIVTRCLQERLAEPPALSIDEQSYAERLRQWLHQSP